MLEEILKARKEDLNFVDSEIAALGGKRAKIIAEIKDLELKLDKETADVWNLEIGQNIVMIPKDDMYAPPAFYRGFTVVTDVPEKNGYGVTEWKYNESMQEDTAIVFHRVFITNSELKKFEKEYNIFKFSDEKVQELLLKFIKLNASPTVMWTEISTWADKYAQVEIIRGSKPADNIIQS